MEINFSEIRKIEILNENPVDAYRRGSQHGFYVIYNGLLLNVPVKFATTVDRLNGETRLRTSINSRKKIIKCLKSTPRHYGSGLPSETKNPVTDVLIFEKKKTNIRYAPDYPFCDNLKFIRSIFFFVVSENYATAVRNTARVEKKNYSFTAHICTRILYSYRLVRI